MTGKRIRRHADETEELLALSLAQEAEGTDASWGTNDPETPEVSASQVSSDLAAPSQSDAPSEPDTPTDLAASSEPETLSEPAGRDDSPAVGAEAAPSAPARTDAVWTVPNILSLVRIALIPLFLWLVLGPEKDGLAIIVLMISGVTDYLDGTIARRLGQTTKLGAVLDPVADRLYIIAVVVGLGLREVIPWWLAVLLPLRDVFLFALVPFLRTRGFSSLPVHFLGKAATAGLLYAFPLLLLGDGTGSLAELANVFGWAFTVWGVGLYWWAGILYAIQVRRLLATTPRVEAV